MNDKKNEKTIFKVFEKFKISIIVLIKRIKRFNYILIFNIFV